ncbi:MAG: tRNA dihydrouridine synthase DusB [Alphaproteobacteria bacterium]
MSISIGALRLDPPVILAPMSGITDLPFRRLVRSFSDCLVVSEMIASQAMIRQSRRSLRKTSSDSAEEYPISVQIAGNDPGVMAQAARLGQDRGATLIDINFGCPAKKVVGKLAGSALMRDLDQARRIIEAVAGAVEIPVSLKMRTGWDEDNRNAPELARIAEDCGIAMLAVHGRTRSQGYRGQADWRFIAEVKEAVSIPVIANGDITSVARARECLDVSNADGVMIGRGAYGRPWFIAQVVDYLKSGRQPAEPPAALRLATALLHYESLLEFYGLHVGVRVARKHLAWYCAGLPGASAVRDRLFRLEDPGEVRALLREFFAPAAERDAA